MNLEKLRLAEADFFHRFPGGFDNPELIQIRKKHHLGKMFELAQVSFVRTNFEDSGLILEQTVRVITRSSLISVFEKMKYRDFAYTLLTPERHKFVGRLQEYLHGIEKRGFETLLEVLQRGRLAKWPLLTILPAYYNPQTGVFVKPKTTRRIIAYFELDHLHYHSTPDWAFYDQYRSTLNEMKTKVDPSLSPYNIAFTGFLMRSIQGRYF
jgi:hypothetical protein